MLYLTSDHHFGHANIIRYSGRPFKDVDEMDSVMIERWNARVRPGDLVVHLGDFSFHPKARSRQILESLNGTKTLVLGNHDRTRSAMMDIGFAEAHKYLNMLYTSAKGDKALVHFIHNPARVSSEVAASMMVIHGHVHEAWKHKGPFINAGVDVRDFAPISMDEALWPDPECSNCRSAHPKWRPNGEPWHPSE